MSEIGGGGAVDRREFTPMRRARECGMQGFTCMHYSD